MQPLNALSPMTVTSSLSVTVVKAVQPENSSLPMTVTESGISAEVMAVLSLNSPSASATTGFAPIAAGITNAVSSPKYSVNVTPLVVSVKL